jgi:hypothetical protein
VLRAVPAVMRLALVSWRCVGVTVMAVIVHLAPWLGSAAPKKGGMTAVSRAHRAVRRLHGLLKDGRSFCEKNWETYRTGVEPATLPYPIGGGHALTIELPVLCDISGIIIILI